MTERPAPLELLDLWLAAFRVGHERVFDLHRDLVSLGVADARARQLLQASAGVALEEATALTGHARCLAAAWEEQSLLDPPAAEDSVRALQRELDRIEPEIRSLQARHQAIARELQSLRADSGG